MHPQGSSIGDFLSFGKFKWFYCDENVGAKKLADEVQKTSDDTPYVERSPRPHESITPNIEYGVTSKLAGLWESVKVSDVHGLEVMTSYISFSAPGNLYSDFSE